MFKKKIFLQRNRIVPLIMLCSLWMGIIVNSANSNGNNPHSAIKCVDCHSMNEKNKINKRDCLKCHNVIVKNSDLNLLNFHSDKTRNCVDCHFFHETENINAKETIFEFDFTGEMVKFQCSSCHSQNSELHMLSLGHFEATEVYHQDFLTLSASSPSQSCMKCHANPNYLDTTIAPQINDHSIHPYEINVRPGEGNSTNYIRNEIDARIKMFDNQIECQTCHTLTNENRNLLSSFDAGLDFCEGCHAHNG